MVRSEGITEGPASEWRADAANEFIAEIGSEKLMFEAADPAVFSWCIQPILILHHA